MTPAAPTWARLAAHAITLVTLPSGIWRIVTALGGPSGYTEAGLLEIRGTGPAGPAYIISLSILTELAALLALGLVQRWGEVIPTWIPRLGGRPVPLRPVQIAAWTGVAVLTALWTPLLFWWTLPHATMTPTGHTVVGILYLPLIAWPALLAAVTLSYQRRRTTTPRHQPRSDVPPSDPRERRGAHASRARRTLAGAARACSSAWSPAAELDHAERSPRNR